MEISLTLLAERLNLGSCPRTVHIRRSSRYKSLMLYTDSQPLQSGCLYLTRGFPQNLSQAETGAGLICLCSRTDYDKLIQAELPLDCLLLQTVAEWTQVFNEIAALQNRLQLQMEEFHTVAYTQRNLQTLVEIVSDIAENPAYLVDSSFKVLAIDRRHDMRNLSAAWKRLEDDGYLPFDLVSGLMNSGELYTMETRADAAYVESNYFYTPFINYNLRLHGRILGHLFVVGMERKITSGDLELVSQLGEHILSAMLLNDDYQTKRGGYHEHFMRDLFAGKLQDPARIVPQMSMLGFYPGDRYAVVVIDATKNQELSNERIASQLEQCCGIKPVFYNKTIAALYRLTSEYEESDLLCRLEQISVLLGCNIGYSDVFQGFSGIPNYYCQAEYALKTLRASDFDPKVCRYHDVAVSHILEMFRKAVPWRMSLSPQLRSLEDVQTRCGADLAETLRVYLLKERCVADTAEFLHIHRNTLIYRIHKIQEISGLDLEDANTRLRIMLSLELLRQEKTRRTSCNSVCESFSV